MKSHIRQTTVLSYTCVRHSLIVTEGTFAESNFLGNKYSAVISFASHSVVIGENSLLFPLLTCDIIQGTELNTKFERGLIVPFCLVDSIRRYCVHVRWVTKYQPALLKSLFPAARKSGKKESNVKGSIRLLVANEHDFP